MWPGPRIAAAVAILAVLAAAVRIGSTWRLFTENQDEGNHIACGMEWLSAGRYTYETQHPPLARVAVALGPYLAGARFQNLGDEGREGRALLDGSPDYYGMLARARAGNLVFFALACAAVWLLARPLGVAAAAASVASFSLIPVVLGHAGAATTDMALTGCLALAWWSWREWRNHPDGAGRGLLAGSATALAVVAKFSAVVFLPAALAALLVLDRHKTAAWMRRSEWRGWAAAALAFAFVCWAVYRFELLPVRTPPGREFLLLDRFVGPSGQIHDLAYRILEAPLPLTGILKGLGEVFQHNWDGHPAYLFGEVRQRGWWYFFPVVLAIKTPLAFALLAVLGAGAAVRQRSLPVIECVAAAAAIVLVSLPSNLNIGVRHVLPVYALLAPAAGFAAIRLWSRSRAATVALGLWMAAGSVAAHPNYLADFNLLAGREPERIVVDSDLDWGQDLHLATEALRARGAREAWIAYSGVAGPGHESGIVYHELPPGAPVHGWVAASVRAIWFGGAQARAAGAPEPYGWLKRLKPAARAGRSILIYDLNGAGP